MESGIKWPRQFTCFFGYSYKVSHSFGIVARV
jgi:hypothetical protein